MRMGLEPPELQVPARVVREFLKAAGVVGGEASQPEQVKSFLEMSRLQALVLLTNAWRTSEAFNELHLLPNLACEGEWSNQPLATREFLFRLLEGVPEGKWWSLGAFIRDIKGKAARFPTPGRGL